MSYKYDEPYIDGYDKVDVCIADGMERESITLTAQECFTLAHNLIELGRRSRGADGALIQAEKDANRKEAAREGHSRRVALWAGFRKKGLVEAKMEEQLAATRKEMNRTSFTLRPLEPAWSAPGLPLYRAVALAIKRRGEEQDK